MPFLLGIPLATVASLLGLRYWLLHRRQARMHREDFTGHVWAVGKAAVAERGPAEPKATVVAMHGFVEDMRYFTEHYADPEVQLILVTSCDYHVPFGEGDPESAPWAKTPSAPEGSIRYDAEVLVQALEHLPRSKNLRVHGHSRGGAVVLEAASLRPDLFVEAEVVLEAPVVPRGKLFAPISPAGRFFFPLTAVLWKRQPISDFNRASYGDLSSDRKRSLMAGLPFHAKHTDVMVRNIEGIVRWMAERDHALYANVRGVILIGEHDKVLEVEAMRASAKQAGDRLQIVELPGSSHFVIFDRPEALPSLDALKARAPRSA